MSSAKRRALGAALLICFLSPPGAAARQTDQELRERRDSLAPLVEAARAASQAAMAERAARLVAESSLRTDTITVGPLRVIARRGQAETARRIFGAVWDNEYASFIDEPARASVEYFTFAWPNSNEEVPVASDQPVRRVELRPWRSRRAVERSVRQQIAAMLGAEIAGTPLGGWINGELRAPADPSGIYRATALAGAESTRQCLGGDARRCWDALGADLTDDPFPLDDWYSPEERIELARAWLARSPATRRSTDPRFAGCLQRALVADCDALLEERLGPGGGGDPFQQVGPRAYLAWLALGVGGRGAWSRMVADRSAAPGEALRAASGLEAHTLAALWRARVVESRAEPMRILDPSILLALVWVGVLAALATRSTRWRLG